MNFKYLPKVYIEKEFVDFANAKISVATNAFQFGTCAWGGMRVIFRKTETSKEYLIFRLDEHVKRLFDSSKMLFLKDQIFTEDFLKTKILDFINENKNIEKDFYIRPIVYASGLGPMPTFSVEKDFLIYGTELGNYLEPEGISVCISSFRRQEDIMIPTRGKIGGAYYISCAAKSEAQERGFDDAIMLTQNGKVSEGSAMNIFMVRDNVLITPPGTESILEGITRKSVIEIAKSLGIEVVERSVDLSELTFKAQEVFFTGTAAKLALCKKIEHVNLQNQKNIFNKIKNRLDEIYDLKIQEFENWITKIKI